MGFINLAEKTINAKLVYYGVGLGGKTTSLKVVHRIMCPKDEVKLVSINTEQDSTLLFDFLPIDLGQVEGFKIRVQGFTVPGQQKYVVMRRYVLQGADAVVLVVDSRKALIEDNLQSIEDLKLNLEANGLDWNTIPLVIQYNKRDLTELVPSEELDELFRFREVPTYETVAPEGLGVFEAFTDVVGWMVEEKVIQYGLGRDEIDPAEVAREARERLRQIQPPKIDLPKQPGLVSLAIAADATGPVEALEPVSDEADNAGDHTSEQEPTRDSEDVTGDAAAEGEDGFVEIADASTGEMGEMTLDEAAVDEAVDEAIAEPPSEGMLAGKSFASRGDDLEDLLADDGLYADHALSSDALEDDLLLEDEDFLSDEEFLSEGDLHSAELEGGVCGELDFAPREEERIVFDETSSPPPAEEPATIAETPVESKVEAVSEVQSADEAALAAVQELTDVKGEAGGLLGQAIASNLELAELYSELAEYKSLLEKKNRELVEVNQLISHDLKKPLTVFKTVMSMMQRGQLGELNERQQDAVENCVESVQYMEQLIQDILDASRLDYDGVELEFEEIDSTLLVASLVRRLRFDLEQHGVQIQIEPLPLLYGDTRSLEKVFMNLLGNAINYRDVEKEQCWIRVAAEEVGDDWIFEVADNGIGIPDESRKTIWKKFERGVNTGGVSGTGLGLYIVQQLVRGHGGDIIVDSEVGRGTTFTIRIPKEPMQAEHSPIA